MTPFNPNPNPPSGSVGRSNVPCGATTMLTCNTSSLDANWYLRWRHDQVVKTQTELLEKCSVGGQIPGLGCNHTPSGRRMTVSGRQSSFWAQLEQQERTCRGRLGSWQRKPRLWLQRKDSVWGSELHEGSCRGRHKDM